MERLTHIDHAGWYIEDQSIPFDERRRGIEVNRLAAYENSGLDPKQYQQYAAVIKDVDIEHIRDLLQAEKDGRLELKG